MGQPVGQPCALPCTFVHHISHQKKGFYRRKMKNITPCV
ncbi:hypothetical protein CsSME_00042812 [Camellia sinensis var. sinensis]